MYPQEDHDIIFVFSVIIFVLTFSFKYRYFCSNIKTSRSVCNNIFSLYGTVGDNFLKNRASNLFIWGNRESLISYCLPAIFRYLFLNKSVVIFLFCRNANLLSTWDCNELKLIFSACYFLPGENWFFPQQFSKETACSWLSGIGSIYRFRGLVKGNKIRFKLYLDIDWFEDQGSEIKACKQVIQGRDGVVTSEWPLDGTLHNNNKRFKIGEHVFK